MMAASLPKTGYLRFLSKCSNRLKMRGDVTQYKKDIIKKSYLYVFGVSGYSCPVLSLFLNFSTYCWFKILQIGFKKFSWWTNIYQKLYQSDIKSLSQINWKNTKQIQKWDRSLGKFLLDGRGFYGSFSVGCSIGTKEYY